LTRRAEGVGHKLYVDNYIFSLDIFDGPYTRGGTVRQNHKGMPRGLERNMLKLKWGVVHARARGNLVVGLEIQVKCTRFDKYA
jgi:hypothetical protein